MTNWRVNAGVNAPEAFGQAAIASCQAVSAATRPFYREDLQWPTPPPPPRPKFSRLPLCASKDRVSGMTAEEIIDLANRTSDVKIEVQSK